MTIFSPEPAPRARVRRAAFASSGPSGPVRLAHPPTHRPVGTSGAAGQRRRAFSWPPPCWVRDRRRAPAQRLYGPALRRPPPCRSPRSRPGSTPLWWTWSPPSITGKARRRAPDSAHLLREVFTDDHVVNGATRIKVTAISNGRAYTAAVEGYDVSSGIAVIRGETPPGSSRHARQFQ